MTRADLEAAAAEKYPQPKKVVGASSLGEVTYTYGPVPRSERAAYIQGRLDALPEEPDPAVIEAMARAIAPNRWREVHRKPLGDIPQARWDVLLDQAIVEGREPSLEAARAAYAAMRGAMQ